PRLQSVQPHNGFSASEVLREAASLEAASEHPLAEAVVAAAREQGIDMLAVRDFQALTGKGVTGYIGNRSVAFGNRSLMEELGIGPEPLSSLAEHWRTGGQTVMY